MISSCINTQFSFCRLLLLCLICICALSIVLKKHSMPNIKKPCPCFSCQLQKDFTERTIKKHLASNGPWIGNTDQQSNFFLENNLSMFVTITYFKLDITIYKWTNHKYSLCFQTIYPFTFLHKTKSSFFWVFTKH